MVLALASLRLLNSKSWTLKSLKLRPSWFPSFVVGGN